MRKVSEEMKRSCPIISEELALANFQLQMRRPRAVFDVVDIQGIDTDESGARLDQ